MANEITNEYPLSKDSYAAFDAISLRNLIIQRLNDQGIFTDQNYIGSNLACIIDIVSYAFNTLIYYLNRTSTESTFTEAQLYENISRIVKLLDYKPIGYQTSTLTFECSAVNLTPTDYTIPRYSYVLVNSIPFSFNEDVTFNVFSTGVQNLVDLSNRKLLYQGIYRENPIYTAAGDPNEVVTINTSNILIDHFNIDVYVYENLQDRWFKYNNVPNLYTERSFSRSFEKRLNSNLLYEITFGDGINGKKLEQGDRVAIYYLQSSGEQGIVGPNALSNSNKVIYGNALFDEILIATNEQNFSYLSSQQFSNIVFNNVAGSTVPKNIETADEIRKNAPANFRSQYRLTTKTDYETFIKTNFANFVNDVKVFSNWDYTSKYLKYFNDINVSPTAFRQILLNQVLYADSCNFNNVYICCVPKVSQGSSLKYLLPSQKEIILSNILPLKTLTTEIVFMDPIFKAMSFGVKTNNELVISDKDFCQLEIIKKPATRRSDRSIANDVTEVFKTFFNPVETKLGGIFAYKNLVADILSVEGVSRIVTRRLDTNEFYNGLSLFAWNPNYIELDKQNIQSDVDMQDFNFVYFDGLVDINSKIQIVEETNNLQ